MKHKRKPLVPKYQPNPLPKEGDFDPWEDDLDAQSAWKNFGGLTLDESHALFRSNPVHYQEAFLFMGWKAFAYYLPVIDCWLRGSSYEEEEDDCQASILGYAVKLQVEYPEAAFSGETLATLESLCEFLQGSTARYSPEEETQKSIRQKWQEARQALAIHSGEKGIK